MLDVAQSGFNTMLTRALGETDRPVPTHARQRLDDSITLGDSASEPGAWVVDQQRLMPPAARLRSPAPQGL